MKRITFTIIAIGALALGVFAAGEGASQKWVNMRIAEQETNTLAVVDKKVAEGLTNTLIAVDEQMAVTTNATINELQRRIDAHLSTNGVTGAWVMDKIADQEIVTQATVDQKIAASQTNSAEMAASTVCTIADGANSTTYTCGNLTVVVQK